MTECQKCGARAQCFLCQQCMIWLRRQLLGLPTLIGHLRDAALGMTRLSNESSRQLGFTSRTPVFNDRANYLIEEIDSTLYRWAMRMVWRHHYVISAPIGLNPIGYTHTSADYAIFLAAHVSDLAKDEYICELCEELRGYVKRALVIVNRRTPDQFCGPCPALVSDHQKCVDSEGKNTCGYRAHECATRLMSPRGAVEVTCGSCGAVHDVQRLVNHLLARADDFRCVISEMYVVLRMLGEPVPMSTLYRWAEPKTARRGSGQLQPAGYLRADNRRIGVSRQSDDDRPLYRVSDARKRRELNGKESKTKAKG